MKRASATNLPCSELRAEHLPGPDIEADEEERGDARGRLHGATRNVNARRLPRSVGCHGGKGGAGTPFGIGESRLLEMLP